MLQLNDPEVYRGVLDSLRVGVYLVDRSGKILYWNSGAERITGYRGFADLYGIARGEDERCANVAAA
jgi:PAS domain-containing protein